MSTCPTNCTDSCQNLLIDGGSSSSSSDHGRLASGILDDIFNQHPELGHFQESDSASECNSVSQKSESSTKSSVDQRLEYWKNMIRERRALQERLRRATGKQPDQMLINHPACLDHRDREMINRILDLARSRYPTGTLPGRHPCSDPVRETRPQRDFVEVVGIPGRIAEELLDTDDTRNFCRSKWINSKLLAERIEGDFPNIQRVLEFYPSIKNMEIFPHPRLVTERRDDDSLGSITIPSVTFKSDPKLAETTKRNLGCLINGIHYKPHVPEFSPILERSFFCQPYEHHLRTVMRIENNGTEAIGFAWRRVCAFAYNDRLLHAKDNEFIFDDMPFRLRPGEVHEVNVMFQPRVVAIVKQRWLLAMRPCIFFFRPSALTLNLHGRCTPAKEYLNRLKHLIAISRRRSASHQKHKPLSERRQPIRLTLRQLRRQLRRLGPNNRKPDDREAFNLRNTIYHCSTHSDAEQIKDFYKVNRPYPRFPRWDYSVRMLIDMVCAHKDTRKRLLLFGELTKIMAQVRGNNYTLSRVQERSTTRLIYVRGIIASHIEEWEEQVRQLEKQHLKAAQKQCHSPNQEQEQENELRSVFSKEPDNVFLRELWRLKRTKPFRDSVYMFSYNLLCNAAEDIVSVIESTLQIKPDTDNKY